MITAIVRRVEAMLQGSGRDDVEVEIVFPVSPDAISTDAQGSSAAAPLTLPNGLTIVPGAASGTCSAHACTQAIILVLSSNICVKQAPKVLQVKEGR